ncbi:hypothetical protein [Brevundimonas sp.]|uniref:hypothetical protein n=1 Tax=Brevundimonas sp. TaxID=1871086 RepID=UPI0025D6DDB2|nr:hypothetical protein [Brevundimonas sp.]
MRPLILLAAALALSACGTALPSVGRPGPGGSVATGLPLGEVDAVRLQSGQCALALWTRGVPATRLAIAVSQPPTIRVNAHGRQIELARTEYDGEAAFGHYPRQTWAGDGMSLTLTTRFAARGGMVGGAVTEDATLSFTGSDGAELVIPVAGLVACQP